MKLAIMQPYFFPYIGYFQLINAVDEFVIYDNIEFTKKGWINRNRVLVNGKDEYITLPLKSDSDYLQIRQRQLADAWPQERKKMLNRIKESYRKTPFFKEVYPVVETIIHFEDSNLFSFIFNSVQRLSEHLGMVTSFVISSTIPVDHSLKAQEKVIEICKSREAKTYINPIGGLQLYSKDKFSEAGVDLQFIKSNDIQYGQFNNEFVPWLSVIDVMMFNSGEKVKEMLNSNTIQ
jgi:hypothetical protein